MPSDLGILMSEISTKKFVGVPCFYGRQIELWSVQYNNARSS